MLVAGVAVAEMDARLDAFRQPLDSRELEAANRLLEDKLLDFLLSRATVTAASEAAPESGADEEE